MHHYACFGDQGKTVLCYRRCLGMQGDVWVVNDKFENTVPAILERCSREPLGHSVEFSYNNPGKQTEIPSSSIDLVTMNQGLHHLPQEKLGEFLVEIKRILRPGGLFVFREHDAEPKIIPLLDLAHSVFNAVLGVS